MRRVARVMTLALAGFALSAAPLADGADDEKPFPADKSAILGPGVYYVEGRVHIPKGVEITVQKDAKIVGRGGVGVIEVEGRLQIHGAAGAPVAVENVTIEVQPVFVEVDLQMVEFRAKSGGILSPKDKPAAGKIAVRESTFGEPATIAVALTSGSVEIRERTYIGEKVSVRAVDAPATTGNSVKLIVEANAWQGCLKKGICVENVSDVTLRTTAFEGDLVSLVACGTTVIDGDYFQCRKIELLADKAGHFAKTTFQRCDIQCEKVVLRAPPVEKIPETLKIDNCWFGGELSAKAAKQKFVDDHDTTPTSGVTALLSRNAPNPLGLAGQVRR